MLVNVNYGESSFKSKHNYNINTQDNLLISYLGLVKFEFPDSFGLKIRLFRL